MISSGQFKKQIVVTGGAGFIGSNFLLYMVPRHPDYLFINIDCLTYAGNLMNLKAIEGSPNYCFEKIDICDYERLRDCFNKYDISGIIHLAAESHVDRSIIGPSAFIKTNIFGTFNLLELARNRWEEKKEVRFLYVSTDEVYGSLGTTGAFTESSPHNPNSPYSASKAAGDHLVRAYHKTYGLDTVTTNCSNNYGPYQFPEKLIPLMIRNARTGIPLPVYGDGKNIRDWLYVEDHCRALELVFRRGRSGETYNIGGHNEIENIRVVESICRILDELAGKTGKDSTSKLITFVRDRPGHDRRYAIDSSYIAAQLGWKRIFTFEEGLRKTIQWYLENDKWLNSCITGEYLKYYNSMYSNQ
jgi:dTDP-glucose 4,6-dehydratase